MAEPLDYTQLDLQNLSPEQAAELARAQQAALARQQHHALLGMLGTVPELQKAGAAEYAQAGKEREGGQGTAAKVLMTTLAKERNDIARIQAEKELAALQQQIQYQNAQLRLQGAQFGQQVRHQGAEDLRADYEAYLRGRQTVPGGLVEREGKTAGELANIENVSEEAAKTLGPLGGLARTAGRVLGAGKRAELAATEEEKRKGGYKTEAPLTFDEFIRARQGGMTHPGAAPAAVAPVAGGRVKGIINGQVKYVDPGRVEEAKSHGWRPAP